MLIFPGGEFAIPGDPRRGEKPGDPRGSPSTGIPVPALVMVNEMLSIHANNCCKIIPCTKNDMRKAPLSTVPQRPFPPVILCARNYLTTIISTN